MTRPATNPFWLGARSPNYGSENSTPASLKIDLHYKDLKIWERWTWDRFIRLCRFLSLTPEELASVVCVPHKRLENFKEQNHLYAHGKSPDRAAALLLTMLECKVMSHLTTDVVERAMPNLAKL